MHTLYVAVMFGKSEVVNVFSEQIVTDCPELRSSQEEADTHTILHVTCRQNPKKMGKKGQLIIKTSDTDAIILCVH